MSEYIYNQIKDLVPVPLWRKKRYDGEFLLLYSTNLEVQYLNETAKDIVDLIGDKTIDQICESLLDMYDVEPVRLHTDVVRVIRELQWKYLIQLKRKKSE